jgi:hypothetical protein
MGRGRKAALVLLVSRRRLERSAIEVARYRIVARRLPLAVCSAALAALLLPALSSVATASGAGGRPELPGRVVAAAFVPG